MRLRDLSGPQVQSQSQSQSQPPGGPSVSTLAPTASIKASSRNGKGQPPDGGDDNDDVDHALGADLIALRGKQTREGQRRKGQVITVEWDEHMQAMSKEKAEAEAYASESCHIPPLSPPLFCSLPFSFVAPFPDILTHFHPPPTFGFNRSPQSAISWTTDGSCFCSRFENEECRPIRGTCGCGVSIVGNSRR